MLQKVGKAFENAIRFHVRRVLAKAPLVGKIVPMADQIQNGSVRRVVCRAVACPGRAATGPPRNFGVKRNGGR